jgi:uncharacterized membrane protein
MSTTRRAAPTGLALVFTASGITHFVRPQFFESIMPRPIPARHHRTLIYLSGVAELICAVGLVRRSRWASAASTAVLIGVLPANVQMATDAGTGRQPGAMNNGVVAWGRLPLQALMIWAARQARRTAD